MELRAYRNRNLPSLFVYYHGYFGWFLHSSRLITIDCEILNFTTFGYRKNLHITQVNSHGKRGKPIVVQLKQELGDIEKTPIQLKSQTLFLPHKKEQKKKEKRERERKKYTTKRRVDKQNPFIL